MSVLAFPDSLVPDSVEWGLTYNTMTFTSPLSGAEQTAEMPGARWMVSLTFNPLSRAESAALEVLLVRLRGASGRFTLHNHARETPLGNPAGVPCVNGAAQNGNVLKTTGWAANRVGLLLPGDYFSVNGELKMVTDTVNSSVTGSASVTFEPPLRYSPPSGTALILTKPGTTFRLVDDKQAAFKYTSARGEFALQAVETF